MAALDGISGARVGWADSKGFNEHERMATELPRNAAGSQLRDHQDQGAGMPGVKHGRELRMAITG